MSDGFPNQPRDVTDRYAVNDTQNGFPEGSRAETYEPSEPVVEPEVEVAPEPEPEESPNE